MLCGGVAVATELAKIDMSNIMHTLFEFFYTTYPYLWQLTLGALSILFVSLEFVSPEIFSEPMGVPTTVDFLAVGMYSVLYAGLGVLGMLFVLHILGNGLSRANDWVSKERQVKNPTPGFQNIGEFLV